MKPPLFALLSLCSLAASGALKEHSRTFHGSFRGHHRNHGRVPQPGSEPLNIGLILPHTNFGVRGYTRAINNAVAGLHRGKGRLLRWVPIRNFTQNNVSRILFPLTPSPTAILKALCKEFLNFNVSAILYLMNYEQYGPSTASAQYFLQLAGYLGIPVIAWNADNSGLERRASQSSLQLQLAPSLEHQTAAMLSILERYKWHQFSVVTSLIAGHDDFIQAVRERVSAMQDRFKFTILNAVLVAHRGDLAALVDSEARVMLLYCTKQEAVDILTAASDLHLTGENYVWVVTQSVIETADQAPNQFPVGMLGVHFDTSSQSLVNEITAAIKVYAYGVEDFLGDPANWNRSLTTHLSCDGEGVVRWDTGDRFFTYLRNVSVEAEQGRPNLEFTPDGLLKAAELKIMNLRPGVSKQLVWEEIGVWKSWQNEGLDIKDIVWPGNSHTPPQGVPEKFHLKITFLEEPPYIKLAPPDPVIGKCSMDRGVLCRVASDEAITEVDMAQAHRNGSYYQCCSGFCVDLLQKFSEELGFTYELVRVEDGKWGTNQNGRWNGLIADLVNRKTDMVLTSLTINAEREAVVDFSVPFMETGIAIVVAKRTGIISPTAFLEPFDAASWMLVGLVAIHAATFTIFLFEWLSPSGFNMKLAFNNVSIDDIRLSRPYSHKPSIKFGTIPFSHTDSTLAKYFKDMHAYMKQFNKTTVLNGVATILSGEMDAFIYDGTVLEYLTSQDEDCRLLTVGSWHAMTGYGLAFPRNSKYLKMFNKRLLDFRENGDLERLRRYWMTGVCKPGKQEHKSSDPLALEQFLSAFLLLMSGILLAALLLLLEHLYFKYIRKHLAKTDRGGCCALISLSMGKSLTFRGAVFEAQDILRNHRCRDPICDTHLWKVKRELDVAQLRIKQLEKEMEVHGIKPPPRKRIVVSGEQAKARMRSLEPADSGSCSDIN
ncbi:hypothetical protein D910_09701, partial [Dendroctonus ponderosae]